MNSTTPVDNLAMVTSPSGLGWTFERPQVIFFSADVERAGATRPTTRQLYA